MILMISRFSTLIKACDYQICLFDFLLINILWFVVADDGKLDTESDSGEFWVLFGGFAPIGRKVVSEDDVIPETTDPTLYR